MFNELHSQIKATYPNALLFVRRGDFYEAFGEDAQAALAVLEPELCLIKKSITTKPAQEFPYWFAIPSYDIGASLASLLAKGHKVAFYDQERY